MFSCCWSKPSLWAEGPLVLFFSDEKHSVQPGALVRLVLKTTTENKPWQQNIKPDIAYLWNHTQVWLQLSLSNVHGKMAGVVTFPDVPSPGHCGAVKQSIHPNSTGQEMDQPLELWYECSQCYQGPPAGCPSAQTLSWEVQQDLIPRAGISTGHLWVSRGVPNHGGKLSYWVAEGSRLCGHLGIL